VFVIDRRDAEPSIERNDSLPVTAHEVSGRMRPAESVQLFSASIGSFRLQEIERAVATTAGNPVMPSQSSPGTASPSHRVERSGGLGLPRPATALD
jgi:hypothetical protein